jgi:TIR domain
MRLFISWSGGRSHHLAVVLKEWLETHFSQYGISVFVSSEIKKGSLWLPAVNAELQRADAGLVCLTAKSLDSEWVLFEAGALSTAVALRTGEARVFTYLLGCIQRRCRAPCRATNRQARRWRIRSAWLTTCSATSIGTR